jgi:hypothetical protein
MRNRALHKLWWSDDLDRLAALKSHARKFSLTVDVRDVGTRSSPLFVICFYRGDIPFASFTDLTGAGLWLDLGGGAAA